MPDLAVRSKCLISFVLGIGLSACMPGNDWVQPSAGGPDIPATAGLIIAPPDHGNVSDNGVTSTAAVSQATVHVTPGAHIPLGASAFGPQGVKLLELTSPAGMVVSQTGAPRPDGAWPARLLIFGTNGSGGVGPLAIPYDSTCSPAQAKVRAVTFRDVETVFTVNFAIDAPLQAAQLTSSKAQVAAGETFTLHWHATNASSVSVDGVGSSLGPDGTSGPMTISKDTVFTMTAQAPCHDPVTTTASVQYTGVPPAAITFTLLLDTTQATNPISTTATLNGTATGPVAGAQGNATFCPYSEPLTIQQNGQQYQHTFTPPLPLQQGKWSVTLQPIRGVTNKPYTCTGTAPGHITFDPGNDQGFTCH